MTAPVVAALAALLGQPGNGVHWTLPEPSELNVNLVRLDAGGSIEAHVNDTRDVAVVALAGSGTVEVDGHDHHLAPHTVVHVPKGSRRGIRAGDDGLNYLTIHVRNPPLTLGRR